MSKLTIDQLDAMPLWQLCEIGHADLKRAERSRKLRVYMAQWLNPTSDGRCEVCLAGSVLYYGLGFRESIVIPPRFALALDSLRTGYVGGALTDLDREPRTDLDREMPPYSHQMVEWHEAFTRLTADLKAEGI